MMLIDLQTLCQRAADRRRHRLPDYEETYHYAKHPEQGYIYFFHARLPKKKTQEGWKFHISVHPEDYERAWPIVAPILLDAQYGMCAFKVFDLHFLDDPSHHCVGKQFVFYVLNDELDLPMESPEHIYLCLLLIEKILRAAKIRAGSSSAADLKIPGSRYASMRHDLDLKRAYVSPAAAVAIDPSSAHNPFKYPNPYADFAMSHPSHRFFSERSLIINRKITPTVLTSLGWVEDRYLSL
jgi:hypothetical protein